MAITQRDLEKQLNHYFNEAEDEVVVGDLAGDGEHYEVCVSSRKFCNKSLLEQHRIVYDALRGRLGTEIHALKVKTRAIDGK